jgi:RNA polymerase sigma-70 factor (ECF subfamily)
MTSTFASLVKKGNNRAFRQLFDDYHAKVYHYVLRFTRDEDDAEDLAQRVFVKVWENREKIDVERSLDAYLFTIAHHLACRYLKQKASATVRTMATEEATAPSTEDLIYLHELTELTRIRIDQLPEKRQIIFKMHYEEYLSDAQIADSLGLSIHTVRSQLVKAGKSIREFIRETSRVQACFLLLLACLAGALPWWF